MRYDVIATLELARISQGGTATDERLHISNRAMKEGFKNENSARQGFTRWARQRGYPEEVTLSLPGRYYRIVGRRLG